jgi:hypothetical protein
MLWVTAVAVSRLHLFPLRAEIHRIAVHITVDGDALMGKSSEGAWTGLARAPALFAVFVSRESLFARTSESVAAAAYSLARLSSR